MAKAVNMKTKAAPVATVVAGFSITVAIGIGEYAEGTVLTEPRLIIDYFGRFVDDEVQASRLRQAKVEEVMSVISGATVAGMDDADANQTRLTAILNAPFMNVDTSEIPSVAVLRLKGADAGIAVEFGEMVPDTVVKEIDAIVKSIEEGDAGPVLEAYRLEALFKDKVSSNGTTFWDALPPIGSRYRQGKGDKPPVGHRLPNDNDPNHANIPVWHGPYDYYKATVKLPDGTRDEQPRHWVGEFVAKKIASGMSERLDHIRLALKGAEKTQTENAEGCPEDIRAMRKAPNSRNLLLAAEAQIAFYFNRRVRVVSDAFRIIQSKRAIEARWNNVKIKLFGMVETKESAEVAARRRKPYTFVTLTPSDDDPKVLRENVGIPVQMGTVKNATARLATLQDNAVLADLLAPKKRGKPPGSENNKQEPGALASEINTTDTFEEYLSSVGNYIDNADRYNIIMAKVRDKGDGGQLAAAIVRTYQGLTNLANNADVIRLAAQFEARSVAEQAATGDKAAAEVLQVAAASA